jgi:subtilisin family serine protease
MMTMRHHRARVRAFLTIAFAAVVALAGNGSGFAQQAGSGFKATGLAPQSTHDLAANKSGPNARVPVIVQLEDAALASYSGGVQGMAPTSPRAMGDRGLDVRSPASQAYLGHLAAKRAQFEGAARGAAPSARITQRFDIVLNGVAMTVQPDQIASLAKVPGVRAVVRDELLHPDTDRSPQFIQADIVWRFLGGQSKAGEGVIIGLLDTGVWPEHPSLSDPDPAGDSYPAPPPPLSGTRACEFSGGSNPGPAFSCNNKLIGADRFMATYDALRPLLPGEYTTARDDNGHGTHTSTTAAGNGKVQASIFGVPRGTLSGIAPRAHVIMYKVCGDEGCFQSDSVAAIQKAIQDGVNVINFSISGGANPYSDAVEQAFLDAYNAGVFVAAAAGNSGPTPDTTDHRGPWVTTAGASTTDRAFTTTATLRASNGDSIRVTGSSVTNGISTPTAVILPPSGQELCGSVANVNPFPPGTFHGEIVVCKRGTTGRVEKGHNVFVGGGGGMILYNPTLQDLDTDNHWVPAVHIQSNAGTQVLDFLASHSGVTATFPGGEKSRTQGDVMAAFSSRGGPGQTLGISKPDVTAPGVQILAGHTPTPATFVGGPPGQLFQAIQGTSMSSPHVAGLAALLKDLEPTWTPGQIKSAIMTTAKRIVVKEDGTTPADAFDDGSGRIDPPRAADPQITFSDTGANFVALQNQLWNANYPSVFVPNMPGIITVQRTAHSELTTASEWGLRVVDHERDFVVTVPKTLAVPAGGNTSFSITMDARAVPQGEVRFATLELRNGKRILHIPITIVRGQPVVPLNKNCSPATFPVGATTTCSISATNTSFSTASVDVTDDVPHNLVVVHGSVSGATQTGNHLSFTGTLAGVQPPNVTIAPGASPAGYLPLSLFGITPIAGMGDETIVNFNVPAFTYAGTSYTRLGVVSNGYVVVGGGTAQDVQFINQNLPDPARPNNVLAAWWTDLNPAAGGTVRIGTLTDGADTWIVIDFNAVREFSQNRTDTFEIWIGVTGDAHPGEDISYAYGPLRGNGDGGLLTVGAENTFGNRGQNRYFNGVGTLPTNGTQLRVTGTPGAPGETHTITFTARGVHRGAWTNYAFMTSNLFQGVAVAFFGGVVTKVAGEDTQEGGPA